VQGCSAGCLGCGRWDGRAGGTGGGEAGWVGVIGGVGMTQGGSPYIDARAHMLSLATPPRPCRLSLQHPSPHPSLHFPPSLSPFLPPSPFSLLFSHFHFNVSLVTSLLSLPLLRSAPKPTGVPSPTQTPPSSQPTTRAAPCTPVRGLGSLSLRMCLLFLCMRACVRPCTQLAGLYPCSPPPLPTPRLGCCAMRLCVCVRARAHVCVLQCDAMRCEAHS
jgi:hypothetical protein